MLIKIRLVKFAAKRTGQALVWLLMAWLLACWVPAARAQTSGVLGTSPETAPPVYAASSISPLAMLIMSRDHSLYYPAYNNASDLDGDGKIDNVFNPDIEYIGIFNPYYCYTWATYYIWLNSNNLYSPTGNRPTDNRLTKYYYTPVLLSRNPNVAKTTRQLASGRIVPGICPTSAISGNWFNWATSTRMDVLRVALYGGKRIVDTTNQTTPNTILERAFIPQDNHTWGLTYVGANTTDSYYHTETQGNTPMAFATLSQQQKKIMNTVTSLRSNEAYMCWQLVTCLSAPPVFWTYSYRGSLNPINRAWTGSVVLGDPDYPDFNETNLRVEVCKPPDFIDRCKAYTSLNGTVTYKPVGILQNYGETGKIKFGLITGSYDSNLSGGILRKNISSFADEIDQSTGIFKTPATDRNVGLIIDQLNKLAIRNFNNYRGDTADPQLGTATYAYKYKNSSSYTRTMMNEGNYGDWGNPIAEMMYEGLRYFKGETSPVFDATIIDESDKTLLGDDYSGLYGVGLRTPRWVDPYLPANVCAKPNLLVISGPNSFDSDQLPGAYFTKDRGGRQTIPALASVSGTSLNVTSLANTIGSDENINGTRLIGQVPGNNDYAPTVKTISNLGQIRGLAPDGANSEGSYYVASVAKFGKEQRLRSINNINIPTVDTYVLQFSHDVPIIKVPVGGTTVTIMPFGKTLDATDSTKNQKGQFQATNQIMAARVEELRDPYNVSNNYLLRLAVNFDDSSWGGTHMMHAVVYYTITADSDKVAVKVNVDRRDEGTTPQSPQNLGYIVSGSTKDGVYLVATTADAGSSKKFFLNVPDGQDVGYCDAIDNVDLPACGTLYGFRQDSSSRNFYPSANAAGQLLKDPLWYAAKWGGYADGAKPTGPTNGDPSNFADLTNPAKLYTALPTMLDTMLSRSAARTSITNSQQAQGAGKIFTTAFDLSDFSGVLKATSVGVSQGELAESIDYRASWNTSSTLTSTSSRNIYFLKKSGSNLENFDYTKLNEAAQYPGKFESRALVDYLRGDDSGEKRNGGNYRNRSKTLGMIVNSVPVYSAETGAVYVAANDGMLHAFDASTGVEKFAYVPTTAITSTNNLSLLASPDFSHRYFMDGNIAVSNRAGPNDPNYLVGFMGRAAKGLFCMWVDSSSLGVVTSDHVWEEFGASDSKMGYLLGQPLFTKLSDSSNDPVVVFGNGYNSTDNKAVLYVVRLRDKWVERIVAQNGSVTAPGTDTQPNGLATPTLVTDSNGRVQYAYAGDYLGNVWKFDLKGFSMGGSTSNRASLVFRATVPNDASKTQPITAAVTLSTSTSSDVAVANKQFLFFGTGSDLTASDLASTQTQSMYGLMYENLSTATIVNTNLVLRSINATGTDANGYSVRSFSSPVSNDMVGKSGWYMNWSANGTLPSEKVTSATTVRTGTTPFVVVSSNVVNKTACAVTNDIGYVNAMDAYHGGGLALSALDLNRNGSFTDETFNSNGAKVASSIDFGIGVVGQGSFFGNNLIAHGSSLNANGLDVADAATKNPYARKLRRISWREIVN